MTTRTRHVDKARCTHRRRVLVDVRARCEVWMCRTCDKRIVVAVDHRQLEFEFSESAA